MAQMTGLTDDAVFAREQRQLKIARDIVVAAIAGKYLGLPSQPEAAATALGTFYQKVFALVQGA
jgi:hypothetical protein